ncbi:MAG: hypothetical protein J6Q81_03090 [Lentisphaeria bacterium]|nr:hypothetical protein [Lentisphaeria bacterium]
MKEKRFAHENLPADIQAKADAMNLDEANVPPYIVPELPITENMTPAEFEGIREHLLDEFKRSMYGEIPPVCEKLEFVLRKEGEAFNGLAIRREIDIVCINNNIEHIIPMLLYIPVKHNGKVPVIFGLNFLGNIATTFDEEVTFKPFVRGEQSWTIRYNDTRADESQRGIKAYRWEFEKVLQHGFAAATICYHDIFYDKPWGFSGSAMRLFYTADEWDSPNRDTGAISAWAWGIMRALDCLSTQDEIDMDHVVVHGHSRLGKAALWAGANDKRIWLTVSNCSGTCGAKFTHRYFGEDFTWLNVWVKHWFCSEFQKYDGRDLEYPVDQHFLMSAIAPRLLYIASASNDVYADPEGEYLSGVLAGKAWNIYGLTGLENTVFPPCGKLTGNGSIGYYLREGEHDFMPENWDALLEFIERHL